MINTQKRDHRSTEIKRLLTQHYPTATVRVHIRKYSVGESIHVKTDLLKAYPDDPQQTWVEIDNRLRRGERVTEAESEQVQTHQSILAYNKEMTTILKKLLTDYESVDRDGVTGDILSGGNTYLFIHRL